MGRKSTKRDKTIYQLYREEAGLTRAQASELLGSIPERRIERIEYGTLPYPDEVVAMADAYKKPELLNYFCTHECKIGKRYIPEIEQTDNFSDVILEILASIITINRDKDRLIEIAADGEITNDEMEDFRRIRDKLDEMSQAIDSFKLWLDKKGLDE